MGASPKKSLAISEAFSCRHGDQATALMRVLLS